MTAPDGRRPAPGAAEGDVAQVVAFRVGAYEFAADVFAVRRVLRYETPDPLPDAPPWRDGTIRLGDRAVPVMDLRKRFSLAEAGVGEETRMVVVEGTDGPVALVVDAAREVLRVGADAVTAPPPVVHGLDARYVQGIIRVRDRTLVLLRTGPLLTARERIVLEPAGREAHG